VLELVVAATYRPPVIRISLISLTRTPIAADRPMHQITDSGGVVGCVFGREEFGADSLWRPDQTQRRRLEATAGRVSLRPPTCLLQTGRPPSVYIHREAEKTIFLCVHFFNTRQKLLNFFTK